MRENRPKASVRAKGCVRSDGFRHRFARAESKWQTIAINNFSEQMQNISKDMQ
jgi:hypothetical protein